MNLIKKIKSLFNKKTNVEFVIPSYEEKRNVIEKYRIRYQLKNFVETGTFLGDTTNFFKEKFDCLYTIELSVELALRAENKFKDDKNISVIQGDSGEILSTIVPTLKGETLFWLDGHYSSEFFHEGEYIITAKGTKNTPIEFELETILSSPIKHVILIDDARLFIGENDYPTIEAIRKKVESRSDNYSINIETDIITITPKFDQ